MEEPRLEEMVEKAEGYLHDRLLIPEEYEALKQAVGELSAIFTTDRAYFVLGSYGRPEIYRLQLVKDRLNRRENAYAFLMVDIRGEWTNTYLKFRLLADYTDYIVGIAEHSRGGFLVEQGYFTALERYFAKTHVFKRDYQGLDPNELDTDVDPENPYSGMQTAIFDLLDGAGRLCEWTTEDDLIECVDGVP
ncbi:hypothetical protein [Halalkalicoccus sp. NIPERK01]|uniref:hypothetical protein n=1 Tax=Halalkalicoccus sp. NIPERK01 TaxID=3053469 RepID=UPI00256EB7FD|nr:hypothetical protein [Halalkalicoccus sp. NIPERK01]MDL5363423.1 hypothetical protein [Halalkalicoccus sp. NIPERK01]